MTASGAKRTLDEGGLADLGMSNLSFYLTLYLLRQWRVRGCELLEYCGGAHPPPLQAIWTVPLGPRLIRIKSCVVHAQRDFVHGTDYRSPSGACLRRTSPLRASYLTQATGLGRGKAWPRRPCPAPVRLFLSTKPSCH